MSEIASPTHILCALDDLLHLTTSMSDVAVFARHPDLPERVLGELPRVTLHHKLLIVYHPGCWVIYVTLLKTNWGGGLQPGTEILQGGRCYISAEEQQFPHHRKDWILSATESEGGKKTKCPGTGCNDTSVVFSPMLAWINVFTYFTWQYYPRCLHKNSHHDFAYGSLIKSPNWVWRIQMQLC